MEVDVEKINEMIRNGISEETRKVADLVFHHLLPNGPQNFLPESIFRDYFLPRFLGAIRESQAEWVVKWISVAGSPTAEVGIVDDVNGSLLFSVPPLLYTNNLGLNKSEGDLGDIFKRYKQIISNLPQSGTGFLMEALYHKNQEYLSSLDIGPVEAQWLTIMLRYGIIDMNEQPLQLEQSADDMFDFS